MGHALASVPGEKGGMRGVGQTQTWRSRTTHGLGVALGVGLGVGVAGATGDAVGVARCTGVGVAGGGVEAGTRTGDGGVVRTGLLGRLGAAETGVLGGVETTVGGGVTFDCVLAVLVGTGVLLGTPPTAWDPPPDGAGAGGRLLEGEPAAPWWSWIPAPMPIVATSTRTAPAT